MNDILSTTGGAVSSLTTGQPVQSWGSKAQAAPKSASDKDTFLQLLVAQLRNQNPLQPADGASFLTQLAQFTALEQTTALKDEVSQIRSLLERVLPGVTPNAT